MSGYTTTVGPRPRPGRPLHPRPAAVTNPNTLSWVTYSAHDHSGPPTTQPSGIPTPVQSSRPLPNPYPRPLRIVNATEPQNLDDEDGDERLDPNAFSPQYPNLPGPSSRPTPQKKPTLMDGLVKGFTNFPKRMFTRSGSSNSESEHGFPTRRATAGTNASIPPLPATALNGSQLTSRPIPQSRYLPKPPSQNPQFVKSSQPSQPLPSSIAELNANTMLLRTYPQAPLSEIPEVESNAPSPPPQVVRLSNSEHPRPRQNSIRRVPPPPVNDTDVATKEEHHADVSGPTVPRITIMDFNESRNTQYPNENSTAGHDEPASPEETMPGGLSILPSHGQTLSYVGSDKENQGAPVFPMLAPPPIRSPSPPHSDTPSSPDIRSSSPVRSPSPRAEPNPNARPPTGILFKPQTISNTRSITPPPSLIPGGNRSSVATPFPHPQPLSEDYDEHQEQQPIQHPTILFTSPLPPMGVHEADDLLSPLSVHPLPADDYRVMTAMSPEPLATQTGTTMTGSSYYRSDRSFSTELNPIERFFKRLYNMPWISRDRVTVDYLPGEQEKRGKVRPKKNKPMSSWYHAVLGRTKRNSNSNSLDLLTTGSGSAHDRDRRPRDERDDRGRTRTKEKRRHNQHDSSTRDKEKHHKHHRHHHSSSSRHRHHHHHDHHDHHHRHHSGSRHSKHRRTTSTEDDEVERMKNMPPMPVYPFPFPPYPIPGLPGFPMPVVATTDDGETLPSTSPPRPEGQPEGTHHERPRTRSQPMGAAFGVYAPTGYQPYQHLVAAGAPPMYMFTPQQLGINVKQAAGNAEHPHPKIEPVTNSPAAPVAQTLANAAAALAAEEKAREGGTNVPGSFA